MKSLLFVVILSTALYGCQKSQPTTQTAPKVEASVKPPAQTAATPVSAKTYDGPFGLAGRMSIQELERLGFKPMPDRPDLFLGTPPKPLQDAESYAVMASPNVGVCRIMARVPVPVVNGSGDQLKEKADQLADVMQVKYGKYSSKVEYARQDVYRRNPQFWMMGLKEDSVAYAYDWEAGKTTQPLPADLETIEIDTSASDITSGYVVIKYTYKNLDACRKEREKRKANSL